MRPAPLAAGVRSVHLGTPILLPQGQYPVEREQPRAPSSAPTFWSPYQFSVPVPLQGAPSIGDARWTPPALWDILGLGNVDQRWPNSLTETVQGPLTKVAFGTSPGWYFNVGVTRPTPSLPLPQPQILPGYGLLSGIRS